MTTTDLILWLSDARGIYIPRDFAHSFANRANVVHGVDNETWEILEAGPDHELYWNAWEDVLNNAVVTDYKTLVAYNVCQDGDCWLVPCGMELDDGDQWVWPETEEEE